MSMPETPISEHDLHAYADGQLDEAARGRVEAWLADHPADAERVRGWQKQNADLRAMFDGYASSRPDDARLLSGAGSVRPAARRGTLLKGAMAAAAAVLIFASGVSVGHLALAPEADRSQQFAELLPAQSEQAYLIYASDVRHPVEVGADQRDHLTGWLSKRLGNRLTAPDLSSTGFDLIGGRLVPVSGEAGAMLMYEDASGRRVSVLVGRNTDNRTTSFRIASNGDLETFYWIDGPLGYAVSGEISRAELEAIAHLCYRQFEG